MQKSIYDYTVSDREPEWAKAAEDHSCQLRTGNRGLDHTPSH